MPMRISRTPLEQLARELEDQRKAADALADDDAKKAARQAYQQALNQLAREAQQRFLLRALYSPNQLQAQMTWFWMNHFNVSTRKANLRAGRRLRRDRHPSACAGALSRPAGRHAAPPGDAALPRQRAERGEPPQRELRPRADGTAHAGCRWRLFARRRPGAGPGADRRGRLAARGRRAAAAPAARAAGGLRARRPVRVQPGPARHGPEDAAGGADHAARLQPRWTRRSTGWRVRPPPRASSRTSWPCTSSPTCRRPRWSSA